jgi:hypothetical protein
MTNGGRGTVVLLDGAVNRVLKFTVLLLPLLLLKMIVVGGADTEVLIA